jgi:hypothetical protein
MRDFARSERDTHRRQGGCGLNLLCKYCMKWRVRAGSPVR